MAGINQVAADCLDVLSHIEEAGYTPLSVERLAELTGHSAGKLRRELATLEARQRVEAVDGGGYRVGRSPVFRLARCLANIRGQRIDLEEMEKTVAIAIGMAVTANPQEKGAQI